MQRPRCHQVMCAASVTLGLGEIETGSLYRQFSFLASLTASTGQHIADKFSNRFKFRLRLIKSISLCIASNFFLKAMQVQWFRV